MIWPLFDRIFRQVYLGPWIRRSNVLTGAEWMRTRFGTGPGGNLKTGKYLYGTDKEMLDLEVEGQTCTMRQGNTFWIWDKNCIARK